SQAACGFQCFAKYGLGLQERAVFQLEAVDRGTFCHRVLAEVFRRLKRAGRTWHEADEAELLAWLNEAIDQQAAELRGGLLRGTARNRFLVETFRRALTERTRALRDESAASDFRQEYAEAGFGFDGSPLPALEIEASESARLRLQGVIDRIDLARLPEDGWAARIWDYKSGAGGFWPALARHGVQLQLPAYLLAMVRGASARGRRILPAGFFYSPLFAPLQTIVAGGEEDEEEEAPSPRAAGFRARGLFDAALAASMDRTMAGAGVSKFWAIRRNKNGSLSKDERQCDSVTAEELQAALGHCERLLRELARAMTTGAIDVAPYRCGPRAACQWCAYRPVCRFDPRREPWRDLPNEKRAEMLERIRDL
ncbi:MAG: PD-(D/E)XK nuclease family protein, partial [Candidatus Sumerlaeota bacterium]|nr:PD-(D/E)XK nuclease family protein [Candidatus Sumerlaeota bacterium]